MFGVCINRSRPSGLWIFEMPRSGVLKNSRPKLIKISETISLYWFFCDSSGPYIPCSSFKPNLGNFSSSTRPPYFLFLGSRDFFQGFCYSGTDTLDMKSSVAVLRVWRPGSIDCEDHCPTVNQQPGIFPPTVHLWLSKTLFRYQRWNLGCKENNPFELSPRFSRIHAY